MRRFFSFFLFSSAAATPLCASAHEVYVLTQAEVQKSLGTPSFSEWQTMGANMHQFIFWGCIAALVIGMVFFISTVRTHRGKFDTFFATLRPYAPTVSRITIGLSLLAAAYYGALFGPELPLYTTFGNAAVALRALLVLLGLMITLGLYTRIAACAMLVLFAVEVYIYGTYMFTYVNYLGEILVLLLLGTHYKKKFPPYTFALLRVCFGAALLYASFYAKILHNNLALQVASLPLAGHAHSIAYYFGMEPHFLVMGAAIVELLVGLFFVLGIEIRFTSLFLLFWLSLSLCYFGEVVWPHIVLIGIPLAFICHGYDHYSLDGWLVKKKFDKQDQILYGLN